MNYRSLRGKLLWIDLLSATSHPVCKDHAIILLFPGSLNSCLLNSCLVKG